MTPRAGIDCPHWSISLSHDPQDGGGKARCCACGATFILPEQQEVLERAKEEGQDICVYVHASDWCRLGEKIKKEIWDQPSLAKTLGDALERYANRFPHRLMSLNSKP